MKKTGIGYIEYLGHEYPVEVRYIKTGRAAGRFRYGKVYITVPVGSSERYVDSILKKMTDWLGERILKYAEEMARPKIYFMGREYVLEIKSGSDGVYFDDNTKKATVLTSDGEEERAKKLLQKKYLEYAKMLMPTIFSGCFAECKEFLRLKELPPLEIKYFRGRWGVCHTKTGKIALNAYLMQADLTGIRYVCFHELTHLKYPDHGTAFHATLEKICPNERKIYKTLKKYSTNNGWFQA